MRAVCVVEKGIERVCSREIKELLGTRKTDVFPTIVEFSATKKELCRLLYLSQSASRILVLLHKFAVPDELQKLKKHLVIAARKAAPCLKATRTIRVDCVREGEHSFNAMDVEAEYGASLLESAGASGICASMKNPEKVFYVHITGSEGYAGIDITRSDLSKREYKLFTSSGTIKGNLAYSLIRLSGFSRKMLLLDPFCGSGTIAIEAAMYISKMSPRHYQKTFSKEYTDNRIFCQLDKLTSIRSSAVLAMDKELRHIKSCQKNAKVAGVDKAIQFSRCDVEWVDTKLSRSSVDRIVTNPPQESKNTDLKELEKTYNEFFYQAKYVLKPAGSICVLCVKTDMIKSIAEKNSFKAVNIHEIYSGKQKYHAIIFRQR